MFFNLQEQGDHTNSFDFFSGFQDNAEFVHVVDFLDAGFDADFTYGDAFDMRNCDELPECSLFQLNSHSHLHKVSDVLYCAAAADVR